MNTHINNKTPDSIYFESKKQKAKEIYEAKKTIYSPYFQSQVILNSDGFHHLQFSARRERSKQEQLLRFTLLPLGLYVIQKSTTVQEYRKRLSPADKKSPRDGLTTIKTVEWWGFVAIFVKQDIKVRVVVRKVGNGALHFWSVMLHGKFRGNTEQKLYTESIENG